MNTSPSISDYVRASVNPDPRPVRSVTHLSDGHRMNANMLLVALQRHCQHSEVGITRDPAFSAVHKQLDIASKSIRTDGARLTH